MSDEATLRISLEGEGGAAPGSPAGQRGAGPPGAAPLFLPGGGPGAFMPPPAPPPEPLVDLQKEFLDHVAALKQLNAALDPAVIRQRVQQENELAAARAAVATATHEERMIQGVHIEETLRKFRTELEALNEQLDPAHVHNYILAEMEVEERRQELRRKREAERSRLFPEVKEIPTAQPVKGIFDQILALVTALRGSLGGALGPLAGAGLDVAAAIKKSREPAKPPKAGEEAPGALEGATGPIALAVAVVAALSLLKDALADATRSVGRFSAAIISPSANPAQFLGTMGRAVEGVSDALFYVNPLVGIFGKTVGAAAGAVGEFMSALDGMVERYADYSPALAQAQAFAELRQVLGDFRRAQQVTPDLVRYLQVRTEIQQRFEDAKVRFMTELMPLMLTLTEAGTKFLPLIQVLVDILSLIGSLLPGVHANTEALRRASERTTDRSDEFILTTAEFLRGFPFRMSTPGQQASPEAP